MIQNHRHPNAPIKAVRVNADFIANTLRKGHLEVGHMTMQGVPMDADLLAVERERDWSGSPFIRLYFIFHHPSWAPIPLGATIPEVEVVLQERRAV